MNTHPPRSKPHARAIISIILCLAITLSGCVNKFADLDASSSCGYRTAPFDEYITCIKSDLAKAQTEDVQTTKPKSDYDLSAKTTQPQKNQLLAEFSAQLDNLSASYKAEKHHKKSKKKSSIESSYYSRFDAARANFVQRQTEDNRRTAMIAAVLVGGAALIAACSHGGCGGGGGQSYTDGDSRGCCSYHNGMAHYCSSGREMCNDGKPSPTCTCN